ncbi:hypothetical protein BH09VER1_BH09VER1_48990 [soil metagenome]
MKNLLLIPALFCFGCAHRASVAVPAPSVGAVKAEIHQAQAQLVAAQASVEQIGTHLKAARTKADRIDGKATVVLENWK